MKFKLRLNRTIIDFIQKLFKSNAHVNKPVNSIDFLFINQSELKYKFYSLIDKIYIPLLNFFKPHNVLKIKALKKSWSDTDTKMFHSMFQLIVDFVEQEQPFTNWIEKNKPHQQDIQQLRNWIETNFGPDCNTDVLWDGSWHDSVSKDKFIEYLERTYFNHLELLFIYDWYKNKYPILLQEIQNSLSRDKSVLLEERLETIEDEMLVRILRIRRSLWT